MVQPGLLQKYPGRALLIATGACGIHCRYCFRRHWPYEQSPTSLEQWQSALSTICGDDSIHEVILSGGDPLTWTDAKVAELIGEIERIDHIRRLRIHTRMPIVIPQRITKPLLAALCATSLYVVVVVHANHHRELDELVRQSLVALVDAGTMVLNQAVLLAGVNDDLDTQVQLSERLIECRVIPYYLHQLDRVAGAAHFEVPVARGRALVEQLRQRLPGYMVPRYVLEEPGKSSKSLIL